MIKYSFIYKIYFISVWLLICIITSLVVVLFPLYESREIVRIQNEKIFEDYETALQSTYWGDSSDVWGFKARSDLSYCYEDFTLQSLESSFSLPCIPLSVPKYRKYEGISILGIDASFVDDAVDFVDIRKYFLTQGAEFYKAQSPGRFPGSGVIRSSSKFIFDGKKILYIFYNERKPLPKYLRAEIVRDIHQSFPGFDEVKLHSFFYFRKALAAEPFDSQLGRLMYYVGDCNLPEHIYCKNEFREDGKYTAYTRDMIGPDLDFFFVMPAYLGDENTVFDESSGPKRFLQGLFKISN